ncbi:MAG: hypothetical protein SCH66_01645 [Methanolobus sp.]|nr:hypothetical protein [Methanolobus sp.]
MNDKAQIHTLEGLAAAILMTLTMLAVTQGATIVTPQNGLAMDVQLEQIASDALAVIDMTPDTAIQYNLTECVASWDMNESTGIGDNLEKLDDELGYLLPRTQYNVDLAYLEGGNVVTKPVILSGIPTENDVVVRRLVTLSNSTVTDSGGSWNIANDELLVVEVRLTAWKV